MVWVLCLIMVLVLWFLNSSSLLPSVFVHSVMVVMNERMVFILKLCG